MNLFTFYSETSIISSFKINFAIETHFLFIFDLLFSELLNKYNYLINFLVFCITKKQEKIVRSYQLHFEWYVYPNLKKHLMVVNLVPRRLYRGPPPVLRIILDTPTPKHYYKIDGPSLEVRARNSAIW